MYVVLESIPFSKYQDTLNFPNKDFLEQNTNLLTKSNTVRAVLEIL